MRCIQNFILAAIVLLVALVVSIVSAASGGDVSQLYSADAYRCAKWEFGIARGYCSYGGVDPNGLANLDNMKAAGIKFHDVYHFPCAFGKSAEDQVAESVARYSHYLKAGSMLWFDIESNPSRGCEWRSAAENCEFIGNLIVAAKRAGIHSGIYTSPYEWSITAGDGCHVGADNGQQLWWADYNGEEGFQGFGSFGGWTRPAIHQWADNGAACGISYDRNWYP